MDATQLDQAVVLRMPKRLSPTQRAFLASQLRHPLTTSMNMGLLVRFGERIDTNRFRDAFDQVVRSNTVLRTQIDADRPEHAAIADGPTSLVDVVSVQPDDISDWATDLVQKPFDLATSCYRSVLGDNDDTTSWVICAHHLVIDATAFGLLVEQTIAVYFGAAPPDSDYYRWTSDLADWPGQEKAAAYWEGRPNAPRLRGLYRPTDRSTASASRNPVALTSADHESIDAAITDEYRLLNAELSLAAILATTTAVFLHRLSGEDRFAIGIPVHHRNTASTAELIGPTVAVYPLDIEMDRDDTFRTLHRRVSRSLMTTLGATNPAITPPGDYEAIVNVIPNVTPAAHPDLAMTVDWIHPGAIDPEHVLRVQATRYGRTDAGDTPIKLDLDIHDQAADPLQRSRAPEHFHTLLRRVLADPDESIYSHELGTTDENQRIVAAERIADFSRAPTPIATRLRDALEGNPATVIEGPRGTLTGEQAWQWLLAVASDLMATTRPGDRIGIELHASTEALVAIYACLITGRSFVPIDPDQPASRRGELARRAGVRRTFTTAAEISSLRAVAGAVESLPEPSATNEAYLLFTSGSTGIPKGVPITHGGLSRYIHFALDSYFPAGANPTAPLFTALTFDLTITTIFAPIIAGGRLVTFDSTGPAALANLAGRTDLTWCKATPTHLELLLALLPNTTSLQVLVVGGEAFRSDLATRLLERNPSLALFNEYGPTEAVVGCMIHRVDPASNANAPAVPIGVPAPGVELRVVDAGDQRQPIGVSGELLISSPGLTVGYLEDEVTNDPSPFVELDGKRFYRSGDLVVRAEAGVLTYLGRVDEQVKVGGIRLDPAEVEHALMQHPAVAQAAVRLWSPATQAPAQHCVRCGLPSNVPDVAYDDQGTCNVCLDYDQVAPVAKSWFRDEQDLADLLQGYNTDNNSPYDCLHLLSGGKDSTYALYRLVELGFRPYALTLDNGYISEAALENCRRVAEDLGIDHEFVTTPQMQAIFRDSLETYSDVCHGCYKTIYTLATNRAVELGVPAIVTGLSRGQLFETRLIPAQFQHDRFDPDAIDRAVVEARKRYHRAPDFPNKVLDTSVFATDEIFESLHYVDIYRYIDVELTAVLAYLRQNTPWERPPDTGRSSNCLINIAGIHAHQVERGYHNYAEPYAWDVRLGHKQRTESMAELDDPVDLGEIRVLLGEIGYVPKPPQLLTAWYVPTNDGRSPTPTELRTFLADRLPQHAIPRALVPVDTLATTTNGKLDVAALPAPGRDHRPAAGAAIGPTSDTETTIIAVWENVLDLKPISVTDDFFALGGDSLAAVTMAVELGSTLGQIVREELAFIHSTPRDLAAALAAENAPMSEQHTRAEPTARRASDQAPDLSAGELSLLFHQQSRPDDVMYNIARMFTVAGPVDTDRLRSSLEQAAQRHEPLTWTYGSPRRRLHPAQAVDVRVLQGEHAPDGLSIEVLNWQQEPFDLDGGPLLRCLLAQLTNDTTVIAIAIHHISGDHQSLDQLWIDIDQAYRGTPRPPLELGYGDFTGWQRLADEEHQQFWSTQGPFPPAPEFASPDEPLPDGCLYVDAGFSPLTLRTVAGRTPAACAVAAAAAAVAPFFGPSVEVGLVSSTRDHDLACELVGYLLNPLPLVFTPTSMDSLAALAGQASEQIARCLPHRAYPFASMVNDARSRNAQPPSGRVLVALGDDPSAELAGIPVEQRMLFNGHAVTDLTFFVEPRSDHVDLGLEYNGAKITPELAAIMLDRFRQALAATITDPGDDIATVSDLAAFETSFLRGPTIGDPELLLASFVARMTERPTMVAVEVGDQRVTHGQLGARAAQLAAVLQAQGIGAGDRVAVRISRSPELPVAILGVLLAGASYVPIDPTYPTERILSSLAASQAAAEVTSSHEPLAANSIIISAAGIGPTPWDDATPLQLPHIESTDEAYVIFTSGSTGQSNGVSITHAQLAQSTSARSVFYANDPERFLMLSSVAFDSSIVGLFWSLATGATLVLPTDDVVHDVDRLAELLNTGELSHVLCVPTLYEALLDRGEPGAGWPGQVIVAGEACTSRLIARHFAARPHSRLTNEYGPTEATVWATAHHCSPADAASSSPVPIGTPIAGLWAAIVDPLGNVQPAGVTGELILGGSQVAQGYLGQDASERFVDASVFEGLPAGTTGRAFRTGDRCRMHDGAVLFLGRLDNQLNVGGARVEPGEIESTIGRVADIEQVVVVGIDVRPLDTLLAQATEAEAAQAMRLAADHSDPQQALRAALATFGRPDMRLVAHYSAREAIEPATLREALADLPSTHRNILLVHHQSLPMLPNGKIDRAAASLLPLPQQTPESNSGDTDDAAGVVQRLMRDILLSEKVGLDQSFFDLGGDSLRALELLRLIEDRLGVRLPTSTIHNAPTARRLARVLHDHGLAGPTTADIVDNTIVMHLQPDGHRTPIFALHNLGVDGSMWRPMSGYLGDEHPMYGIADPFALLDPFGDSYNLDHRPEIAETAARYVEHIQRIAPDGPIVLLGFCLGGVFGYEVAQQLQAAGREVENFIIVLDWHAPHLEYEENWVTLTKLSYRRSGRSLPGHIVGLLTRRAFLKSLRRRVEGYAVRAAVRLRMPLSERLKSRQYVEEGIHRIHTYEYRPYEGRITVIRSTEDPRIPTDLGSAGWGDLVDDLEVEYVPGVGEKMLYEPHIERVTEVVRHALVRRPTNSQ